MKLLSLLLPAVGLLATVASAGKDVVYTTVIVPVYTTYCPSPTTFTHKNHTYTVTKPTHFTVCETKTITKKPYHPHHNYTTTKPPHHNTTKTHPTITKTTKTTPTLTITTSKKGTSTPPPVTVNAAQRIVGAGARGALAVGVGIAAFLL